MYVRKGIYFLKIDSHSFEAYDELEVDNRVSEYDKKHMVLADIEIAYVY